MAEDSPNDWPEILKGMMRGGHMTYRATSAAIGKAETYMGSMVNNSTHGAVPSCDVLATIAEACGYELHLTGHGQDRRIYGRSRPGGASDLR